MGSAGSAAYKFVSAVSAEIVDGTPPLNRLNARLLCHPPHSGHLRSCTATPSRFDAARQSNRPRRCTAAGAYSETSLVSAVMPSGNGPLNALEVKNLRGNKARTCRSCRYDLFVDMMIDADRRLTDT